MYYTRVGLLTEVSAGYPRARQARLRVFLCSCTKGTAFLSTPTAAHVSLLSHAQQANGGPTQDRNSKYTQHFQKHLM